MCPCHLSAAVAPHCRRTETFHPARFSRGVGETKIPTAIFAETTRKTESQGAISGIARCHCRDQETQSKLGLPPNRPATLSCVGVEIDKDVIRRVLARHYRPEPGAYGPSWLTVLGHTKDSLWSIDLFRCESLILISHWVLVVMDQFTRRIIGFGVHSGTVDGPSLCRMFNQAICGAGSPRYVSSDNDPLFRFHRWKANLRILEVTEVKTVPHLPVSHPFVERLIGTIRREYLDLVPFWNARDLERKLSSFKDFYNDQRCHYASDGDTPSERTGKIRPKVVDLHSYRWRSHCRGLYHLPVAA